MGKKFLKYFFIYKILIILIILISINNSFATENIINSEKEIINIAFMNQKNIINLNNYGFNNDTINIYNNSELTFDILKDIYYYPINTQTKKFENIEKNNNSNIMQKKAPKEILDFIYQKNSKASCKQIMGNSFQLKVALTAIFFVIVTTTCLLTSHIFKKLYTSYYKDNLEENNFKNIVNNDDKIIV